MKFHFTRALAVASLLATAAFAGAQTGKICIDPGHGGSDSGAVGGSQTEKANVLNTGLRFRDWMNDDTADSGGGGSWNVIMTRTTDVFVDLAPRCTFSNNNGANRFMSIHNNACGCGASGTETFCWGSGSTTSYDLRNKVQQRMIEAWGLSNRGNKTANYYVIVNTNAPAELAECGFVDNAGDRNFLGVASQQDKMGKYKLFAIQSHYGLSAYTPGGAAPISLVVDNSNTGFAASANWLSGTAQTDKYGADYRYRSTAAVSDSAAWTVNITSAGTYTISAWWSVGSNRSTTAPYVLPSGTTVNVNQQANGGVWNTLGTNSLSTGNNTVRLSCWTGTGFVVLADAVRFVK